MLSPFNDKLQIVVREILSTDTRIALPPWVVSSLKTKDPVALIRYYISYDLLFEALTLAVQLLKAAESSSKSGKPFSSWIPINHIYYLTHITNQVIQEKKPSTTPVNKLKLLLDHVSKLLTDYITVASDQTQTLATKQAQYLLKNH